MNPIKGLLRSRKFWLLIIDTVVSLIVLVTGWFLSPENIDKVVTVVGIIQPVFVAVVVGIFTEDAAAKRAGTFSVPE